MKIKVPFFELELSDKDIQYIVNYRAGHSDEDELSDYMLSIPVLMIKKLTNSFIEWLMRNILIISSVGILSSILLRFFIGEYISSEYLWVLGILEALTTLFSVVLFIDLFSFIVVGLIKGFIRLRDYTKLLLSKQSPVKKK